MDYASLPLLLCSDNPEVFGVGVTPSLTTQEKLN